ncbi:MAG: acyl-CoA dehydrogenase family protein, partial [Clostridia bacterium]|nr:acyl-CoA dehydrogenase family protein [Clostridia bacterium]
FLEGCLPPSLLWNFGSEVQKQKYLVPVLRGEQVVALGVTEPTAGNDVRGIRTTARRDGDEWVLNGEKCFITLANYAAFVLVLAYVDRSKGTDGMSFFIVETDRPGFRCHKMDMWANRPAPTTQLFLDDVRVPEANRLDAGFREIMLTFNKERILVAARWLGHAQHAFEWALQYAKERQQFGKPIGHFQSIAFQLADAKVDIEASRWLTYHAAWRWDQGLPVKELIADVSVAKLHATQTAYRVTQTALHIAGGWGLVKGVLPAMRMAIDALVAPVTVGSFEIQKRILARQLGLECE